MKGMEIEELLKQSDSYSTKQTRTICKLNFYSFKKSSGFGPEINLKNLNSYVNYNHFKMVVLSLKFISFERAP